MLQGVTKADLVEVQKLGACEEVIRRWHGCCPPIMVSIVSDVRVIVVNFRSNPFFSHWRSPTCEDNA